MALDDGEGGGGSSEARQEGQPGASGGSRRSAGQSFSTGLSLEDIRSDLCAFAQVRDWEQFHTPRNLALALTGEVHILYAPTRSRWREAPPPEDI